MNATHGSTDPDSAEQPSTASSASHLREAKEQLKEAASAAGSTVKEAASGATAAVREEFASGRERVGESLAGAREATSAAAREAAGAANEQFDHLLAKGKALCASAERLIQQRPFVAFGTAFAVGWLMAKLARHHR